jgi:diguanylate cyclase (GGDEF)-like protein
MDDAKTRALAYQMVKQEVLAKKMKLDALSKQNSILQLRQALASQAQKTSRLFIALLLVMIAFVTLAMLWLRRSQLRFRRMARHDGLTGAFNRDHFFEEAARVLRRLHKTKIGVCLVVLDLDHFKQVNDTYGHAAGDEVLRRTVMIVRQELRSSDVFGRLGGEEFGILMPACSRQQGVEVATRIRCALAATSMVLDPQTTITVSASFGLAFSADSGQTLHQLLIDADTALYCAKDGGRNQVIVSVRAEDPESVQGDARVAMSA